MATAAPVRAPARRLPSAVGDLWRCCAASRCTTAGSRGERDRGADGEGRAVQSRPQGGRGRQQTVGRSWPDRTRSRSSWRKSSRASRAPLLTRAARRPSSTRAPRRSSRVGPSIGENRLVAGGLTRRAARGLHRVVRSHRAELRAGAAPMATYHVDEGGRRAAPGGAGGARRSSMVRIDRVDGGSAGATLLEPSFGTAGDRGGAVGARHALE